MKPAATLSRGGDDDESVVRCKADPAKAWERAASRRTTSLANPKHPLAKIRLRSAMYRVRSAFNPHPAPSSFLLGGGAGRGPQALFACQGPQLGQGGARRNLWRFDPRHRLPAERDVSRQEVARPARLRTRRTMPIQDCFSPTAEDRLAFPGADRLPDWASHSRQDDRRAGVTGGWDAGPSWIGWPAVMGSAHVACSMSRIHCAGPSSSRGCAAGRTRPAIARWSGRGASGTSRGLRLSHRPRRRRRTRGGRRHGRVRQSVCVSLSCSRERSLHRVLRVST